MPIPRPTDSMAAFTHIDMQIGASMTNFSPVSSGMFLTSHSGAS